MGFRIIESAAPEYLAATDILIGDMSNINYEFLIYNRPVILLANEWINKYIPDFGIKTDLLGVEAAIKQSLDKPEEYEEKRKFWLEKTIYFPEEGASKKYIEIIFDKISYSNPIFYLLHGDNAVRKTNILPIFEELKMRKITTFMVASEKGLNKKKHDIVFIGAHIDDLKSINYGYKIHIDHDLKGIGTANIAHGVREYRRNNYFPQISLHITAGMAGDLRTKYVLGPFKNRTVIGGYPKADDFLRLSTIENKIKVYRELGFDIDKPLITYAPAGVRSYMKPGGSLTDEVVDHLKAICNEETFHVLVKRKPAKNYIISKYLKKNLKTIADFIRGLVYRDNQDVWLELRKKVKEIKR